MLASGSAGALLRTVHPGERIEVAADADGAVAWLEYHPSIERYARFQRKGDGFDGSVVDVPLERRLSTVAGTVESSLFEAGLSAGLTDRLVMELVEIFAWDVDFALDIRVGDSFTVVHEELLKDGEKVRDGAVLAAEFVNRGRALRAVRYEDPSGLVRYYTPEGESLRKAFLRTPVKFSRISSRFTLARMHPVLHRFRAHKGVDYAAPRGTPVKATGDGKVAFVGRKGGYGKTVVLQHGSAYTTLYGHLSRFARGLRQGDRVTQGDLIGYVGSTGLATGPHLHYEFRVRGVHRDPLTVKLPRSLPIPAEHKRDFGTKTRQLIATLEAASQTRLASTSAAR
ncbi:MAG: peptidoglycan DD-metalloendopeptidase family protein [Ectothiorhodospiraceae bacterium]|nr:peptidoglycan DD-metalloendopeptidase family protein [Chromatiales bacterium]MCP5153494.1 peptidoglycan DD-metalloendopeptidase family protein [Ectothiorhodospiraceae bacterium]